MRGKEDRVEEGGEEGDGELRFLQLLQASNNRDLAANWAVDVSRELDKYLTQLSVTALFEDGSSSLNFAQAALLIQGSIQIYSRKVEYLYALVLQALEFIAQKKQAQQEKSSVQADGKDAVIEEEAGEEEFLNLDDVEEEKNIDIDDEGHETTLTPATKPPASLIVLEGEGADIAADGGELAAYQIASSSLHRDFLLLDPCDADAVDKFLNVNKASSKGTPLQPSSSARRRTPRTPRNGFSTPSKRAASVQKSVLSKEHHSAVKQPEFNDVAYDQGTSHACDMFVTDAWEVPCREDLGNDINKDLSSAHEGFDNNIFGGHAASEVDFSDDEDDPWQPLNPHEPGDLPVKPYRRGLLNRKQKAQEGNQVSLVLEFPLARRFGTICPQFKKVSEAREHNHGKQSSQSPLIYEKLRSSFGMSENASFDAFGAGEDGDEDESAGVNDDFHDDRTFDDYVGASNDNFMEMDNPVQLGENNDSDNLAGNDGIPYQQKDLDVGGSFEDLCRAHLDALLRNIAESEKQTELATRVSTWKQKIEKNLEEQDRQPPFDIHVYGERVLGKLSLGDGTEIQKSFTELVSGEEKHEVARTFAALLQLVNNGNVDLDKSMSRGSSFCFTAQEPFFVRLLNSSRRHEEMLKYRAPSMAATHPAVKACRKSKDKSPLDHQAGTKIRENTNSNNGSPETHRPDKLLASKQKDGGKKRLESTSRLGEDYKANYSANSSRRVLGSGSGFTPVSKRRRRLGSVRPLEVEVGR